RIRQPKPKIPSLQPLHRSGDSPALRRVQQGLGNVKDHLPRRPGQRNHGLAVQLLGGDLLVGYRVDPSCGLQAAGPSELSAALRNPRVLLPEVEVVRKPGRQEILEDLKRRPTGAAPLLKPATRS